MSFFESHCHRTDKAFILWHFTSEIIWNVTDFGNLKDILMAKYTGGETSQVKSRTASPRNHPEYFLCNGSILINRRKL